jgi:hypothetical protein
MVLKVNLTVKVSWQSHSDFYRQTKFEIAQKVLTDCAPAQGGIRGKYEGNPHEGSLIARLNSFQNTGAMG